MSNKNYTNEDKLDKLEALFEGDCLLSPQYFQTRLIVCALDGFEDWGIVALEEEGHEGHNH